MTKTNSTSTAFSRQAQTTEKLRKQDWFKESEWDYQTWIHFYARDHYGSGDKVGPLQQYSMPLEVVDYPEGKGDGGYFLNVDDEFGERCKNPILGILKVSETVGARIKELKDLE